MHPIPLEWYSYFVTVMNAVTSWNGTSLVDCGKMNLALWMPGRLPLAGTREPGHTRSLLLIGHLLSAPGISYALSNNRSTRPIRFQPAPAFRELCMQLASRHRLR
jgi:hypothetical protein